MAKKKKNKKTSEEVTTTVQPMSKIFKSLEVDELLYIEEVEPKFKLLMIKFVHFLRKETFSVSTDALIRFFKLYHEFDIFELDEMKGTMKTLFVKSKDQLDSFDRLFEQFFFGLLTYREEQVIDEEKKARIQEKTEALKQSREAQQVNLEELLERLRLSQESYEKEREQMEETLAQERQACLKQYEETPLTYRRKKELGEKELTTWAISHEKKIQELLKETNSSEEVQQTLIEFFKGNQSMVLNYFNQPSSSISEMKTAFSELMLSNLQGENIQEINQLCVTMATACMKCHHFVHSKKEELAKQLASMEKEHQEQLKLKEQPQKELQRSSQQLQQQINQMDNQLKRVEKEVTEEVMREIQKEQSLQHRELFTVGKNAVQLTKPSDLLERKIEKMNVDQYEALTNYIKANAVKFRTKISRSMVRFKHQRFNYRRTMKESLKTFGVPMELYYEKPKLKKTKVVCILDVSGSCAKSSKLLLRFVYELADVFKGGVYSYVFIRQLAEVSPIFKEKELNEAIAESLVAVPRDYSDYHYALQTFHEHYLSEVDRHTIVLFLGDARNNQNPSGIEFMEAIEQRAKAVFWLNTEEKVKWNVNDSIIGKYEPYLDGVYEILTTQDLISFLEQFKLD